MSGNFGEMGLGITPYLVLRGGRGKIVQDSLLVRGAVARLPTGGMPYVGKTCRCTKKDVLFRARQTLYWYVCWIACTDCFVI